MVIAGAGDEREASEPTREGEQGSPMSSHERRTLCLRLLLPAGPPESDQRIHREYQEKDAMPASLSHLPMRSQALKRRDVAKVTIRDQRVG